MGFHQDLEYGNAAEEFAISLYEYDEVGRAPKCVFKDWDFWLRSGDTKVFYEVKKDKMTKRTGNVAIEFECSGKPSGISTTKADNYLYFIEGENVYYEIPVDYIKQVIAENKYKRKVRGGDDYRSHCYLFAREVFDDYREEY